MADKKDERVHKKAFSSCAFLVAARRQRDLPSRACRAEAATAKAARLDLAHDLRRFPLFAIFRGSFHETT